MKKQKKIENTVNTIFWRLDMLETDIKFLREKIERLEKKESEMTVLPDPFSWQTGTDPIWLEETTGCFKVYN